MRVQISFSAARRTTSSRLDSFAFAVFPNRAAIQLDDGRNLQSSLMTTRFSPRMARHLQTSSPTIELRLQGQRKRKRKRTSHPSSRSICVCTTKTTLDVRFSTSHLASTTRIRNRAHQLPPPPNPVSRFIHTRYQPATIRCSQSPLCAREPHPRGAHSPRPHGTAPEKPHGRKT
jgi:hypothetical protein